MPDDSLEILWRGADPAKFTALQAALRDEGIRFWEMLAHDHAGGFLNARPYYLEAVAGFEIRVYSSDLLTARGVLQSLETRAEASESQPSSWHDSEGAGQSVPALPIDWDPREATSEIWSGEEEGMAEYVSSALAENGIPCRIPEEPGYRYRLYVRPGDHTRAKEIVREIMGPSRTGF